MSRSLLVAVLLVALSAPAAESQRLAGAGNHATPPAPVALDTTGMFQAKFAQVGDDIFIGGQPTARALRDLKARGVTTIVNLRTAEEMARVSFDEGALARELGIRYVHLPMRGTAELPYGPAAVTALAEAIGSAEGKVLLHCTIAWRASHLWAAYLIQERGVPAATAIAHTRAINLMDEHRMDPNGQPVELFLGRKVEGLGRL